MGTVVKAKRDGFRRAGLVHFVAGTFYPDGELSDAQLKVLREDPHLLVVEDVQEDSLQADAGEQAELLAEMGITIASLEHSLESARAGLKSASADLIRVLEQQKAAPALILAAAQALEPADATVGGVMFIAPDTLLSLISDHLKPLASAEAQTDDTDSASNGPASSVETSKETASISPTPPATGPDADVVKGAKGKGKRGGSSEKDGGE